MNTPQATQFYGIPDFLRWQVRVPKRRPAAYPLYDSTGYIRGFGTAAEYKAENTGDLHPTPEFTNCVDLLGFGYTKESAERMANAQAERRRE